MPEKYNRDRFFKCEVNLLFGFFGELFDDGNYLLLQAKSIVVDRHRYNFVSVAFYQ